MAGEIGYLTIAEADAYFVTRLSSSAWPSVVATKTAALTTAFDRMFYSGLYTLPTLAAATATQLVVLKKAQCELALYMVIHLADEDRRKGLQAQGVTAAGIVKEQYAETDLMTLPIPPIVAKLLAEYSTEGSGFYAAELTRDEDSGINW